MKQLTCEMCGSNELVKQDGVFVCQACGTKYSTEEAKKMMIEGSVDVQGTVKVDTSDKVKNLYKMARRAKDDNNAELAAKYYEMITFENPDDWEALFYFKYFKARDTNLQNMDISVIRLSNSLDSIFDLICNGEKTADEKWDIAKEIIARIDSLCVSWLYLAKSHYRKFSNVIGSTSKLKDKAHAIAELQRKMADLLEKHFPEKSAQVVVSYLKSYVQNYLLLDTVSRSSVNITLESHSDKLIEAEKRIKALDPNYVPLINNPAPVQISEKGKVAEKKIGIGIILCVIIAVIVLMVSFNPFGHKINSDIVGTWRSKQDSSMSITFKSSGNMIVRSSSLVNDKLSYEIDNHTVIVTFTKDYKRTFYYAVEGDTLVFGSKYYTRLK